MHDIQHDIIHVLDILTLTPQICRRKRNICVKKWFFKVTYTNHGVLFGVFNYTCRQHHNTLKHLTLILCLILRTNEMQSSKMSLNSDKNTITIGSQDIGILVLPRTLKYKGNVILLFAISQNQ